MRDSPAAEIPTWIWLGLMPLPLIIHLASGYFFGDTVFFLRRIESESGVIENGTALLLIPAFVFALLAAHRLRPAFGRRAWVWFGLYALMCFGFAGEEISWGQHWWGWNSPEYFAEHNRQGETNLHNLNIHLGRVAKSIVTLAIIIGGLVMPLMRRSKPADLSDIRTFVIPSFVCVPAAAFVFGVRLIERFKTWFDLEWSILAVNLKENQELYIAVFLLIYAWSAARRAARAEAA